MSLSGLLVHDVTIVHPAATTDRYNNALPDWDNTTDTLVRGWVSQRSASEVLGDRAAEVSEWILYLEPDATIAAGDRVTWEGITFEVAGPANPAWSPRGRHHFEVPLRVVDG